jgi:hypothetical protein
VSQLVVSAEVGATIAIDGKTIAQGRFDGQVDPGPHHVNVSEPGKQTYRADVDLRDGETRQLQVTLLDERREIVSGGGSSPWPWIIGGAVVVAGAAVGGYFLLKPSATTNPIPPGTFGGVTFAAWGR